MANIIIFIISLIFAACCTLLELAAKLFGWTYTEACVYINLYLQYGIMMLSTLSVVYVAARKNDAGILNASGGDTHREHTLQYPVRVVGSMALQKIWQD